MNSLLQIEGWFASGKSVLMGLLDGHPDIGPHPVHDAVYMSLLRTDLEPVYKVRDIERLRSALVNDYQYYYLEKFALKKKLMVVFSADVTVEPAYDFDFYAFDKRWVADIIKEPVWNAEIVMSTIYKNLAFGHTGQKDYFYHPSMSWPDLKCQSLFLNQYPSGKSILVKRPILDIVASRAGRKESKDMANSAYAPGFERILNGGEIEQIIDYYAFWDKMVKENPSKYLIVDLNDLVEERKMAMTKVAHFLGIEMKDSLLHWSILGQNIVHNGVGYADILNDKVEVLLTSEQIERVKKAVLEYSNKKRKHSLTSQFLLMISKKIKKASIKLQ